MTNATAILSKGDLSWWETLLLQETMGWSVSWVRTYIAKQMRRNNTLEGKIKTEAFPVKHIRHI